MIHNEPNGLNINNGCGSTHIESLQKFVVSEGCEVGFAFDGDADRCLAVDEDGNLVNGDQIMYVTGKYMKECGQLQEDTIVTTVMSNFGLYKALDEAGIKYQKTKVGDRFVYENMSRNGYSLGGEQSGHIIFLRHATTGDGILTSIKVMETMLGKKQSLKELCQGFTVYPQVLKNVRVLDKEAAQNDPRVLQAVDEVTKALGEDGRILLRASGTEPVVRVMVEAGTEDICEKYVDQVIDVMRSAGLVVTM